MYAAMSAITVRLNDEIRHSPVARVASIDVVRGIAMILMAIDHVRVYSGVPPGASTFGIFFTRWITHFVAPTFVFLAGTSAYLHGRKLGSPTALSKFLMKRGLWLVLLELTVLRLAWTFNLDFSHYMLAGVIWMLGWCMVLMAGFVFLPLRVNAIAGIVLVVLHNVTDFFRVPLTQYFGDAGPNWLLKLLYFGGEVKLGGSGPPLLILYVIVPWIGLMMAGYAFGRIVEMPQSQRRQLFLRLGLTLSLLFLLLRAIDLYGDPRPWRIHAPVAIAQNTATGNGVARPPMPPVLRFLNANKYPASLDFLLMTIGPMLIVMGLVEHASNPLVNAIAVFGRVPMFYYLLHIPLIHAVACLVSIAREGSVNPWLFANHPLDAWPVPPGYTWSLAVLYGVFVLCVVALYFPCNWYARLRATRKWTWLSYL
jgi:uncharacterized membrane protein